MSVSCGDDRKQINPWCRVCLVSRLRMCSIQNIQLKQIYDKLTNKLNNDCGIPEVVCYICYSQLKRAQKFSDMAQKSQMILREMRLQGIEPYNMTIMPNFGIAINLSLSAITNTSIPNNTNDENVEPSGAHPIKLPHNFIKTEPICEPEMIDKTSSKMYLLENKSLLLHDNAVEEMYFLENTSMVSNNDRTEDIDAIDDVDAIDNIDAIDNKDAIDVDDTEIVNADSKPSDDDIAKINSELNINEETTSQTEFIVDMKPVNINKEIILENGIKISIGDRAFASITSNENINVPHKGTKQYTHVCKVCKRTFSSEENLRRHVINNKEHKRYSCNNCNRTLPSARALKYHLAVHAGKKPYACNFCDKTFYQKIHMHQHVRTHTGEKPYFCKICSKSYSDQSYFKIHLLSHTGQKPFACDLCKKSFTLKKTMERHRESHSGLKPFKCDICLNSFSSKSAVRSHMIFHSGLMLYKCKYCDKKYSQRRYLISHLVLHSSEKPYACQLCNRAYTRKNTLRNHMKFSHKVIHSTERPYVCQLCNKGYTRRNNLRSHMKTHVKLGNSQAGFRPGSQVRGSGQDDVQIDKLNLTNG